MTLDAQTFDLLRLEAKMFVVKELMQVQNEFIGARAKEGPAPPPEFPPKETAPDLMAQEVPSG